MEAAFAGALGVRLGGANAYGARVEHRPVLGAPGRTPDPAAVHAAADHAARVGAAAALLAVLGALGAP